MRYLNYLAALGLVVPSANSAGSPLVGPSWAGSTQMGRQGGRPLQGSRLGRAVLAIADLNGDGVREVAVGAPVKTLLGRFGAGAVVILDGAKGWVLSYWMPEDRTGIGHTLAPAPDVDGDGLEDVLVGFEHGAVTEIRSADGGAVLGVIPEESTSVFATGDLDGDGVGEFLVPKGEHWRVYSSRPGDSTEPLLRLPAPTHGTFFPLGELGEGGEADGLVDGLVVDESAVAVRSAQGLTLGYEGVDGSWLEGLQGVVNQAVRADEVLALFAWGAPGKSEVSLVPIAEGSGTSSTPIAPVFGSQAGSRLRFGYEMCPADDLDGDGARDFAIASQAAAFTAGAAAFSSADGSLLWKAVWTDAGATSRVALESFDDIDGDGVGDILAGTSDAFWHGRVLAYGSVRLLSGATGKELWVLEERDSGLGSPFEAATIDHHRLVILTGKPSRRRDQIARLERDLTGAAERNVLLLVAKEDSVEVRCGELPFELPLSYLQDRFEMSALDFELTLVGIDGKPKAYLYQETEPPELWRLFDGED